MLSSLDVMLRTGTLTFATGLKMKLILSMAINAGEGVEKREPSYTVGGNVNWCSH